MNLSIVIACRQDPDIRATVESILETTPVPVEIVVVDDVSVPPVRVALGDLARKVRVVENRARCGCGPSRHIGVTAASADWIMITDPHMRFMAGWFPAIQNTIETPPYPYDRQVVNRTIFCGTCLGLDSNHKNPDAPAAEYCGGQLVLFGDDPNNRGKSLIMEVRWHDPGLLDGKVMSACLGACYFMRRDWFLKLGALKYLRIWGLDEFMLSAKCWLAGGEIRYVKDARFAHKFYIAKGEQPFLSHRGNNMWNKMLAVRTLGFNPTMEFKLARLIEAAESSAERAEGNRLIRENWHIFEEEAQYNRQLFGWTPDDVIALFGLQVP